MYTTYILPSGGLKAHHQQGWMARGFVAFFCHPRSLPSHHFWTNYRDPITETENGFMEPTYLAFHFGDYKLYTSIIIWQSDWILRVCHHLAASSTCSFPMSFPNSGGAGSEGGQCTKKTHAKVPHIQHHQWHHHRHDGIPQSKPMVQNSNGFGKINVDIKTVSHTTSQTCDNQQIWLQKILVQWFFHVRTFYLQTFLVALKLSQHNGAPQPEPGNIYRVRSRFVLSKI